MLSHIAHLLPFALFADRPAALAANNPGLAKLLFALVFPVGLFMNTMHGTELFTGNTMKLPAAIIEGKVGEVATGPGLPRCLLSWTSMLLRNGFIKDIGVIRQFSPQFCSILYATG